MNNKITKLSDFEKLILDKLKMGQTQDEISKYLLAENIKPSHIRSIEGKIRNLKKRFEARTTISLVYKLSKNGFI